MADHSQMKLGRVISPPAKMAKRLMFARYAANLPAPPETCDWTKGLPDNLGVMGNDTLGDCTAAGLGHMIQCMTGANGNMITLSDADIIAFYSASTGYVPGDPTTDQGGNEVTVLNTARAQGIGGHVPKAFMAIDANDHPSIRQAAELFGGVYLGVDLPLTAQTQDIWTTALGQPGSAPGSWGGHCVVVEAYDAQHATVITWGQRKLTTWDWLSGYCTEAYAILWDAEWAPNGGKAPNGFDYAALLGDLAAVAA